VTTRRALFCGIALALAMLAQPAGVSAAGDAAEAATARKFAAIRSQPLALEAFLREMPKGGDLHNHFSGSIYAESYMRWAVEDKLCVVLATFTLAQGTCDAAAGRPLASDVAQNSALYNQAIDAWSMRGWPAGQNGHHHFFQTFLKFNAAASIARDGDMLAEITSRAAAEHVSYLEVMMTPDGGAASRLGREAGWPGGTPGAAEFAALRQKLLGPGWAEVLERAKQRLNTAEARRRDLLKCDSSGADAGCLVTVRYISQVLRANPPEQVFAQILAGFELQTGEPRIVGLNLVQPEDDPVAVRDFALHMSMIDFLRPLYPKAQVTLHAGEITNGLVAPEALRFHIRDSIRRGHAMRIGHGVDVMQEDDPYGLMREMAARKVLVEIALTSNDLILGVSGARHPLRTYLRYGVPVALATDDYGVSRSTHTLEWVKAVQEHALDYLTVKRIVRNSIDYSFVDASTKAKLKQALENAFKQFEQQEAAPPGPRR
jgi:adenosine deaminase